MSQLYDLYVAEESEAKSICNNPSERAEGTDVPAFDEFKQLTLLSMYKKMTIPARDGSCSSKSAKTLRVYHKHFKLLYPPEVGKQHYVAMFPPELVKFLADLKEETISTFAERWMSIEPSFAEFSWTPTDVSELLQKVSCVCKRAREENKQVLFRFSL